MTRLKDLTISQLQRMITLKEQIESLQSQMDSLSGDGGGSPSSPKDSPKKKKRRMSAAARAAIGLAVKARWAKMREKNDAKGKGAVITASKTAKKKRKVSTAVKAKLAKIAKARWAKAKAEGKRGL